MGTARNMFPSKDKRDLRQPILVEDLIQYDDLNATGVTKIIAGTNVTISSTGPSGTGNVTINASGGSGTVTGVTATGPITSTGGTAPMISTSMATNRLIGRTGIGTGVMEEITVGIGLSLSGGTLSNSAPAVIQGLQDVINVDKSIVNDVLTIGTNAGMSVGVPHAVAIGEDSLVNNDGGNNVGIGYRAGYSSTTRANSYSILIGTNAGNNISAGNTENIAIGAGALIDSQTSYNVAIGTQAGKQDTGNGFGANVFIGNSAGFESVLGSGNQGDSVVAIGSQSLGGNTGNSAVGVGAGAGRLNTSNYSVFVGPSSGDSNSGVSSVGIGYSAASSNIGENLVAVGEGAAASNQGNTCIAIGYNALNSNFGNNVVGIGNSAGSSNGENGQFIISNTHLPSFNNQSLAFAFYSSSTNLSPGCTYLYWNDLTKTIEGYRT